MKTVNVNAHSLVIEQKLSSSVFVLAIEGTTPGRKLVRLKIECDGPLWVEEFARELHTYLTAEQGKIDAAKTAMKGT